MNRKGALTGGYVDKRESRLATMNDIKVLRAKRLQLQDTSTKLKVSDDCSVAVRAETRVGVGGLSFAAEKGGGLPFGGSATARLPVNDFISKPPFRCLHHPCQSRIGTIDQEITAMLGHVQKVETERNRVRDTYEVLQQEVCASDGRG